MVSLLAYRAVGTWEQLCGLGLCDGIELPPAPKRVRCLFHQLDGRNWSIRAVKGKRWILTTYPCSTRHDEAFERAIARHRVHRPPARGHLRLVWSAPQ